MPVREAISSLLLLALLGAAVLLADDAPGPGPLAPLAAVAAAHAAVLSPAFGGAAAPWWGMLPLLLSVPALGASAYGHPGAGPLAGAVLLVVLSAAAGTAARALRGRAEAALYLPSMALVFAAPYALHYLVREFAAGRDGERWLLASPVAAVAKVAEGAAPPAACVLLLLLWPVWALARRRA
jgi:hypothetical protein